MKYSEYETEFTKYYEISIRLVGLIILDDFKTLLNEKFTRNPNDTKTTNECLFMVTTSFL